MMLWRLRGILFSVICGLIFCPFQSDTLAKDTTVISTGERPSHPIPFKKMLSDPLSFSGPRQQVGDTAQSFITIGLLVPDGSEEPVGQAIMEGAQLAVSAANRTGGYRGKPYRLVRRWADDPWQAGSREMIRLVYADKAVAVIGYMSAISHIAEQVAVKAYVPVLTPVSTDTSLTRARVPWIFQLPPNDRAQAGLLVKTIVRKIGRTGIGLITSTNQDSRMAAKEIQKAVLKQSISLAFHIELDESAANYSEVLKYIKTMDPKGLIIKTSSKGLMGFLKGLAAQSMACPLFVPWIPGINPKMLSKRIEQRTYYLVPFAVQFHSREVESFLKAYGKSYGRFPLHTAFFAYDAVQMVMESIASGGAGRSEIRDKLAQIHGHRGLAGYYTWDSGGGNQLIPKLTELFAPCQEP